MMKFYGSCVIWPDSIAELQRMIDKALEVTRATFLKHVDRESLRELEDSMGYVRKAFKGLTMANDYHVNYYKSILEGQVVYFLTHSAVEYAFNNEEHALWIDRVS
jgi:hypothetical protein